MDTLISNEDVQEEEDFSQIPCVLCGTKNAWRIKLRGAEGKEEESEEEEECGHVSCINCALVHLENWINKGKERVKCPSPGCQKRIHENDLRALLDPECCDLDHFMSREKREKLLFDHDSAVIRYAFGSDNTRNCPGCGNIYAKKVGCNHVRCPNLFCNTWFCWQCTTKDVTWAHFFTVGNCRCRFDDILKALYIVSFLLFSGGCTLFYFSVSIYFGLFLFSPLIIAFFTPYLFLDWIKKQWFTREEMAQFRKWKACLFWSLFTLLYVLLLPAGGIVAILSLFVSTLLFALFITILFIKLIPIVGNVICIIELLQCITGCFGYDDWLDWWRRSREEKDAERVANRNFRAEGSERLFNPKVGR